MLPRHIDHPRVTDFDFSKIMIVREPQGEDKVAAEKLLDSFLKVQPFSIDFLVETITAVVEKAHTIHLKPMIALLKGRFVGNRAQIVHAGSNIGSLRHEQTILSIVAYACRSRVKRVIRKMSGQVRMSVHREKTAPVPPPPSSSVSAKSEQRGC
jgi:hypothetical protein